MISKNNELKYLIKPVALLLVVVVLFILVSTFGFKQISLTMANISELKDIQKQLSLKLDILETVSDVLSDDISFIDIALPSKGSILYGLSQIKKQAATHTIIVSSLKAGSQTLEENGISKTSISFEAEGGENEMYAFLNAFYKVLPIMNIEKIKLDKSEGITKASVTVYVYSAELPERIPSVTEAVNGFTAEDTAMINELSSFTTPDFFEPKPSESAVRENPFN